MDEATRWVITDVDPKTIRTAKTLAVEHGVRVRDVIELAVQQLWTEFVDTGHLRTDWKPL